MDFLVAGLFMYVGFLFYTLLFILVSSLIRVIWARIKKRKTPDDFRFKLFIRKLFTRTKLLRIFIFIPLGLAVILLLVCTTLGSYRALKFRKELQNSAMLKIKTWGYCHQPTHEVVYVYETKDVNEIKKLIGSLSFRPTMARKDCICCGELSFDFYKNDRDLKPFSAFSLHHDTHIRMQRSSSGDVYLTRRSRNLLDNWLSERGIRQIQQELDTKLAEEVKSYLEKMEKKAEDDPNVIKTLEFIKKDVLE